MYKIIKIKIVTKITEDRSKSSERYFKIRNFDEIKPIDIWEFIELRDLWVEEYSLYQLDNLINIINKLKSIEEKMIIDLEKFNPLM